MVGRTSSDVVRSFEAVPHVSARPVEALGRYGQAPDAPRDSDVVSRPSRMPVAFYLNPWNWQVDYLGGRLVMDPTPASTPAGNMLDDTERMIIDRPSSSSYAATLDVWSMDPAYAAAMPGE